MRRAQKSTTCSLLCQHPRPRACEAGPGNRPPGSRESVPEAPDSGPHSAPGIRAQNEARNPALNRDLVVSPKSGPNFGAGIRAVKPARNCAPAGGGGLAAVGFPQGPGARRQGNLKDQHGRNQRLSFPRRRQRRSQRREAQIQKPTPSRSDEAERLGGVKRSVS